MTLTSKRTDAMETLRLTLELLRRIPRNRRVTAKDLHDQLAATGLHRDLRTIQRQLEVLSEQFEIERDDRSKPYGYRWKERAEGFSLPGMDAKESLILALAEQQLSQLLPSTILKSMAPFFAQAGRNLQPTSPAQKERAWLKKVKVVSATQPLLPPTIKVGIFEAVSEALYRDLWLSIDYTNAQGARNKADVMPLGLAQQGPRLYLVCRFGRSSQELILALHRLTSARATTLQFERPKEFNLEQYDGDGKFGFGEGNRIQLVFDIEKEAGHHLLESPLSRDQMVKVLEDHFRITATVVESAQLEWWLRGFGSQVGNIKRKKTKSAQFPVGEGTGGSREPYSTREER